MILAAASKCKNFLQSNLHTIAAFTKSIVHKTAVVALYTLVASLHLMQAPLSLLTFNIQRAKLNWTAFRVAFYALYSFTLPKNHPYHNRFDFHHLLYGLAFMLLPGRPTRFGKWITFDSLVNYNLLGVFNGTLSRQAKKTIFYEQAPIEPDGSLYQIARISFEQQSKMIKEKAFPADNCFVRRYTILLKEIFYLQRTTPLLDAISDVKDRIAIDEIAIPFLQNLKKDPERLQLKIAIDLELFKG